MQEPSLKHMSGKCNSSSNSKCNSVLHATASQRIIKRSARWRGKRQKKSENVQKKWQLKRRCDKTWKPRISGVAAIEEIRYSQNCPHCFRLNRFLRPTISCALLIKIYEVLSELLECRNENNWSSVDLNQLRANTTDGNQPHNQTPRNTQSNPVRAYIEDST